MTNGSRTLSYTPDVDAVVVERVLDAGGTIVGKTNLDDFSGSGFGVTSVFGPPQPAPAVPLGRRLLGRLCRRRLPGSPTWRSARTPAAARECRRRAASSA